MSNEADVERIQKALDVLGEHFDTVQIFATRSVGEEQGNTLSFQKGTGNWFARYGQVQEWLIMQDEEARIKARKLE